MTKIARYLVNRPKLLHLIIAVIPISVVVPVVIILPLWLIPGYFNLLEETASQYPRRFIAAVTLGTISSTCSIIWAGRKTWLETAALFPPSHEKPKD